MIDQRTRAQRLFLTDTLRGQVDFSTTDQQRGMPPPPLQKPADPLATRIQLAGPEEWEPVLRPIDLHQAIARRQSRRRYSAAHLNLAELSFLLWATQGVHRVVGPGTALRTVPSAGARHSFETYLAIQKVTGVTAGLYRFLPLDNQLVQLREDEDLGPTLTNATFGQSFVGSAAVTFIWACIPYRSEWRYGLTAHRVILLDAGHLCQNLYLACEAIEAGTCAVAAYDQHAMDDLVGLDGEEEFVVYLAPAGKR
ncbi:SagB/ThcOx family dehydrogenase [Desulfobulbus alkaliphilus]|uniref:SagB/ThcOx family dehydrogenase n=1 Tax=Desulfobulbus alkaliphilus TaxID=869814 RepID=UPI0019658522|nr:SagB/ThcOx family dehydrogenase [Desulfobulbus alkaliphilus]MBM9538091.1 SagB/ThcOx family dehydrogenase [Desulfobulbus alkaliphilus]